MFKETFRRFAFRSGRMRAIYLRWCNPNSLEYANYLRLHGGLHHIGNNVRINQGTEFTDPAFVSIGNNVIISTATFIGHDGSVDVMYSAYGESVDAVGKIVINDNVFIGHGAIVLRGVSIGPNAIVAAGAVVSRDVLPGDMCGGVPARPIGRVENYLAKLRSETEKLPWAALIRNRKGFDPELEPELLKMRSKHFFNVDNH